MARLPDSPTEYPLEVLNLRVDDPDLDLAGASALAREKARAINRDAMLLSWHSGKTGAFRPQIECGTGGRAPWIVFAEARGCNLRIDINDGEFVFYYLRL